jgi:hypothetical protein
VAAPRREGWRIADHAFIIRSRAREAHFIT